MDPVVLLAFQEQAAKHNQRLCQFISNVFYSHLPFPHPDFYYLSDNDALNLIRQYKDITNDH